MPITMKFVLFRPNKNSFSYLQSISNNKVRCINEKSGARAFNSRTEANEFLENPPTGADLSKFHVTTAYVQ